MSIRLVRVSARTWNHAMSKLPIADFGWDSKVVTSLKNCMMDHERWSIEDGRITHDTGLTIINRKVSGSRYSMELCLKDMTPFCIDMYQDDMTPYWELESALSRAEAQETYDRVAVLLKLCE